MIITQKKPMEELMAMVGDAKTVAIVGCNSCATACHTGGEPEVAAPLDEWFSKELRNPLSA